MAILVDEARWRWRGRVWAHLSTDGTLDDLHAFAARLGVPRGAFQGDHYDVPAEVREHALRVGAVPVDSRELLRRMWHAGIRPLPPRRQRANGS